MGKGKKNACYQHFFSFSHVFYSLKGGISLTKSNSVCCLQTLLICNSLQLTCLVKDVKRLQKKDLLSTYHLALIGHFQGSTYNTQMHCSKFSIATFFFLTNYHIMLHFDALKIYSCGKHCEKRRNCLQQAISPFLTMFSTLYGTYFSF